MATTLFEEALYTRDSIPEALSYDSSLLRATGNPEDAIHANKIDEYRSIIFLKKHSAIRKMFDGFFNVLDKEMPDVRFRIAGRRKSLISFEEKICQDLALNKSLDIIRDMLGVRIILFDNNINTCYQVLELIIRYCFTAGYTICEKTKGDNSHLKGISPFLAQYSYGITDYIKNSKDNGYQSLHVVFRNASGDCFEVQIRTFDMHVIASFGSANHVDYKDCIRDHISVDRTMIHMPGYSAQINPNTGNIDVMDLIGVERSVEILQRNKAF